MAASILAGSIGTLAMTSVRAAGATGGNTLQNYHVPATAIDAASKTNEGVFSGRANRLFSTPLTLEGDAFGINTEASAEHHVAVSSRERGRKLQDEDDDDQCDSEITVTSAIFSDAEGCYEKVDDLYYLSPDGEHAISSFFIGVGTTEVESGWAYGSFTNEFDVGQLVVTAVCYYDDSSVPLDEIPNWECDLEGDSTFAPVSPENFSVSCGCSETTSTSTTLEPATSAPTGGGTNGEDTPAPSEGGTITSTPENTPAPSTTEELATPVPTENGTNGEDTPAPSEGGTAGITSMPENTPAPSMEQGQTPTPSAGSRGIDTVAPSVETHSTQVPSHAPTHMTDFPTHSPQSPTHFADSMPPTGAPTMSPTDTPTMSPTDAPTMSPTVAPTMSNRSVDLGSLTTSPTASPSGSLPPQNSVDPANVGTLPFKMPILGMIGASVAAILVGLMPFVV